VRRGGSDQSLVLVFVCMLWWYIPLVLDRRRVIVFRFRSFSRLSLVTSFLSHLVWNNLSVAILSYVDYLCFGGRGEVFDIELSGCVRQCLAGAVSMRLDVGFA
jgi:hypothetical protein